MSTDTTTAHVLVTGASGFIGSHAVPALLGRGARVAVLARNPDKIRALPWGGQVEIVPGSIGQTGPELLDRLAAFGCVLHLAWEGLPNYKAETQLTEVLPRHLDFLTQLARRGARRILAVGTCLEYGLVEGQLSEDTPCRPVTAYGQAKHRLRLALEPVCAESGTELAWARLFYMHGPGQSEKSLLSQLDRAISSGADSFDMSGGQQWRDYLPVEQVADMLARLALANGQRGVLNCASGEPVSVLDMVQAHLAKRGATIQLNLGRYPYPDYEPFRFWADTSRLAAILGRAD